jgi:heme exporter protein B
MIFLFRRDVLLAARNPGEWATPLVFFLLVAAVFPLAVGPAPDVLRRIAPGVIWAVALLSSLLSQDSLFRADADDGALEQILLSPHPLALSVLAKTAAHWLAFGMPLVILAPLLGAWMQMRAGEIWILVITLPLGTAIFSMLAAFAAALSAGARRRNFLGALIALPLCLPAVIFAAAAVHSESPAASLLLLAALFTLSLTILPLAAAGALRVGAGDF